MKNLVAIFKINKCNTKYEVYDDEGLYEYSVEATPLTKAHLIHKGYKYLEPKWKPTKKLNSKLPAILNPTSLSDAHIEAQAIWAECNMPPVRQGISHQDWEQLTEMFYDLGNAILIGDHKYIQKFIEENK